MTGRPLRLLFVCGASTGGAFRSSLELAEALERRGHTAAALIETGGPVRARLAKRLLDAEVRFANRFPSRLLAFLRRRLGVRARPAESPTHHLMSPVPENAVPGLARRIAAQAVVVSSIRRPAWRAIKDWCRAEGVAAVLYMRGVSELDQLEPAGGRPDLLLANTRSVAERARRAGHAVTFIPSLVDLSRSTTETTREVALLVSPTELQGVATVLELAALRPDVSFALQHSWDIGTDEARLLRERIAGLTNVELRPRRESPAEIYRDARILIAPHRIDNRPRVILEAQANGIPVIATAHPGIVDQMGDGGIAVPPDAGADVWLTEFSRLWDDPATYADLSDRARRWARRPEQDEDAILDSFVAAIRGVIEEGSAGPQTRRRTGREPGLPRNVQDQTDQPMDH